MGSVGGSVVNRPLRKSQPSRLGKLGRFDHEKDVVGLLEDFSKFGPQEGPPFVGRELLEYLIELGILRRRAEGRVPAAGAVCGVDGLPDALLDAVQRT